MRQPRTASTLLTLLAALAAAGCNTLYDTDSVVLEQPDADASADTGAGDLAPDAPSDAPDLVDDTTDTAVADLGDAADPDVPVDLADATDTAHPDAPSDTLAPDAPDLADLTDTGGDTSDTSDASDTPEDTTLDCTGQCGAGANCQACDGTCVDIATNAAHCGGCNADCTTLDNVASPSCIAGECRIPLNGCADGWANCDDNTTNGCEQDTATNFNNCGACDNPCSLIALPPEQCIDGTCQ